MSIIRQLARVANRIDSASTGTFLSKGDSTGDFTTVNYTDLSGRPTTLDSAALTSIVDSAYIQARQTSAGSGGLDSAAITALIDSNYVVARSPAASSGFANYEYTATAGQTTFQDSDINGNVMSYTADGIFVFYNGVLIAPTTDYEASDGSSVVLTTGADSGSHVAISKWNITSVASSPTWYGDRGVWMAGNTSSSYINNIDYIDITSAGNATDFGDLSEAKRSVSSFSNGTIGLSAGGQLSSNENSNVIEYITFATTGNATDFGDLSTAVHHAPGSSDGTTGLISGGKLGSSGSYARQNIIQSVTIATASNASDFGDLTFANSAQAGCNDATYSITMGGEISSPYNHIEYVTIATPGNSADFGDLITGHMYAQGLSDTTRGLIAGGYTGSVTTNSIEYITIASPGNATDFGDLVGIAGELGMTGCSNATTGVFAISNRSGLTNIMESVIIQTTGNATDFGDLTSARRFANGSSGSPS